MLDFLSSSRDREIYRKRVVVIMEEFNIKEMEIKYGK